MTQLTSLLKHDYGICMHDDNAPITEETEEAILKALTDAVFEANHLTTQFPTEEEKKAYNHFAVLLGKHPLQRDIALSVDSPIEHQIQMIRKIHSDLDHGANLALTNAEATPKQVLDELLLKMDDIPASVRVFGDLSHLPDQYKDHLVFSLIGFFAAAATKGEYKRPLESVAELAKLKGVELSTILDQDPNIVESLKAGKDPEVVDGVVESLLNQR